ncbi:MAG: uracil-DNA glycosylase [Deltaproteobacteria bacterium]|nr:uracil-DNA glycosylase [Deltaproteobacteria bacterium]
MKREIRKKRLIDCHKCKHYYVTWDKRFPCGCYRMKFKGKTLPATLVLRSSNMPCLMFEPKER